MCSHTKWSSPVASTPGGRAENDYSTEPANSSPSNSPTRSAVQIEQDLLTDTNEAHFPDSSPLESYKVRDNRESQSIEEDLDYPMNNSWPVTASQQDDGRVIRTAGAISHNDDTTDDSDENLGEATPVDQNRGKLPDMPITSRHDDSSQQSDHEEDKKVLNPIPETPRKSAEMERLGARGRVQNIISPRKKRTDEVNPAKYERECLPSPPKAPPTASQPTADTQNLALEEEKKLKRLEKRKEAETIVMQKAPATKKRRF